MAPSRHSLALIALAASGTASAQNAPPRVITRPASRPTVTATTPDGHRISMPIAPPAPTIPPDYVLANAPPHATSLLRGSIYWLRGRGAERTCERWNFAGPAGHLVLERRVRRRIDGGLWESHFTMPFEGDPPSATYAIDEQARWLRPPPVERGSPGAAAAIGGIWPFEIVSVSAEAITWVEAHDVIAYHPSAAQVWYRTRAACEAQRSAASPAP